MEAGLLAAPKDGREAAHNSGAMGNERAGGRRERACGQAGEEERAGGDLNERRVRRGWGGDGGGDGGAVDKADRPTGLASWRQHIWYPGQVINHTLVLHALHTVHCPAECISMGRWRRGRGRHAA